MYKPRAVGSDAELEQHALPRSIALHLLPGVALLGFLAISGPIAQGLGLPVALITSLGIVLVLAPLELGPLLRAGWRPGQERAAGVVGYRERLPLRQTLPLVALLLLWFMTISALWRSVVGELEPSSGPLAWLASIMPQEEAMSQRMLLLVAGLRIITSGLIAPVVEELYFRGYLLPRLSRLGRAAALLNALLFAVYHLWTPLLIPGRVLGWLPTIYVVQRTRSLRISIAVHLLANLAGVLLPIVGLLQGS